jgi:hypothetical protein
MGKYNSLFKKIEVFEKLAVYGNRSNFLKAIAQETVDPKVKAIAAQMESLLKGAGVTDESILAPFGNVTLFGHPPDMAAISAAVSKAMTDPNMSTITNANALAQLTRLQQQLRIAATPADPGAGEAPMMMPTDRITGYAPIDKQKQRAVFQFVLDEGLDPDKKILPTGQIDEKDIDGKLGKQTRGALEAVKNYFAQHYPNNPRMSDQQAMTAANTPAPGKAKTQMA